MLKKAYTIAEIQKILIETEKSIEERLKLNGSELAILKSFKTIFLSKLEINTLYELLTESAKKI